MLDLGICKNGRMFKATWDSGRSFNKFKVEELLRQAVSIETSQENVNTNHQAMATIVSVVSKEKKQGRPIPLNTVGLLKACSKALGIGPHSAMQTAERLYLSGYLSYPRTESTAYPKSFDIRGTLQSQSYDSRWGTYVTELLKDGKMKSKGGVDMGDHPPITPCRAAGVHELSGDMQRVYELVTRHFIASVSHDAVWKSTKISIRVDSLQDKGNFSVRGKQMVSPGFLAVLLHKEYGDERDESSRFNNENDDNIDEEEIQDLPDFSPGEIIPLSASASTSSSSKVNVVVSGTRATLGVKEKMTTAPSYLTESELIGQMEKHGIGTDASISTHIENILKRNYVELIPGRRMSPSKLGLVLAQGYHLIDSSLVLPKIRAESK
jgi:DNA topoisomerase-3